MAEVDDEVADLDVLARLVVGEQDAAAVVDRAAERVEGDLAPGDRERELGRDDPVNGA